MTSPRKRGPSGTQPKPKGRPLTALLNWNSANTLVYFIAYREKFWDTLHEPPPDDQFVWEFYYSKNTYERAKERVLLGRHPKMYVGKFPLAALLHPKIATLLPQGGA